MKPKSFEFRLDRTAFSKQLLEEADQSREWWLTRSGEERIVAGLFLTYLAFGIDPENPPLQTGLPSGLKSDPTNCQNDLEHLI